jgi:hypothetical protein
MRLQAVLNLVLNLVHTTAVYTAVYTAVVDLNLVPKFSSLYPGTCTGTRV